MVKSSSEKCCILIQEIILDTTDFHLPCKTLKEQIGQEDFRRCALGGIPAGLWAPGSLHACNGAHCETVETPGWETMEMTMESQNFEARNNLGFLIILWISSSHSLYFVIGCLFNICHSH